MTVMTWVIVFVALAVLALIAIAACAWPVWKAAKALLKQFGDASGAFGEAMESLSEALDQPAIREASSRRR
ncbi:hypothetical protein [Actinospica sp.]|uniref:hypothetical protein n=1 Tax=Actinospica sp. TaxID=1872142 RepID=UPI002C423009|nr:hypothetical protein [Actinospica sp.]HWG28159.1 hypothetical protein [Actinospica sp.]